jgi:hypothetical protein
MIHCLFVFEKMLHTIRHEIVCSLLIFEITKIRRNSSYVLKNKVMKRRWKDLKIL